MTLQVVQSCAVLARLVTYRLLSDHPAARYLSVAEVEAVQAGSGQPLVSPRSQVHREVDMTSQCSEPSGMETADGGDVASHGADGEVLMTTGPSLIGNPVDEHAADALTPSCLSDDDRLDLPADTSVEQAGQTDDQAVRLGYPGSRPLRGGEVVIESRSGIVSADRRVPIDTSVVLRQLCPEGPARPVVAFGIVANDDLRPGWRVRPTRIRHGLIMPGAQEVPSRDDCRLAELSDRMPVEGRWMDRIVGLEGVRAEIAFVQNPDGHGRLELTKFHSPQGRDGDQRAPEHTGNPACLIRGRRH